MCLIDAGLLIAYVILITHALDGVADILPLSGSTLKLASLDAACSRGGRCWVCVRCFVNSRLVIRTVRFQVSPDKKILRHLQDSKYQDDADNHYERDEEMHTG
jgi:hypothetical protein